MSSSTSGPQQQPEIVVDVSSASKFPAFIKHDPPMQLGEALQYRPSDNTLHYLDIEKEPASVLYVAQLDNEGNLVGEPRSLEIKGSRYVTALAFRKDTPKSYLCTTNTGLAYLSEETGQLEHLPNFGQIIPEAEKEGMRFNDAYCDTLGRFYFHSMSRDESSRKGKLYMYHKDMKSVEDLVVLEDDFAIGNGPIIDEKRGRFYFNKTSDGIGYVYDWDASTGRVSNRREFFNNHKRRPSSLFDPLTTMAGPGFPDGLILDSVGNIYQAVFGRGMIERFTPDGVNDLTIKLSARCPTCPVFAGKDRKQLYITTASKPLMPGEKEIGGDTGGCVLKVDLRDQLIGDREGFLRPEFAE